LVAALKNECGWLALAGAGVKGLGVCVPTATTRGQGAILMRGIRTLMIVVVAAVLWLESPLSAQSSSAQTLSPQTAPWQSFGNSADGFKALFPSEPEVTKNSVPVDGNTFELHSYVSQSGETALYIGVVDYGPRGAAAEPDALLNSAKNGAIEHMNAHILSEKKITLVENHGVSFEAESDKLHFSARMYMAGGVLYQVMVAAPLSEKFADTNRFLDSFQLTDRPARAVAAAPAPPAASTAADWKPYSYAADGFSASFPSQPAAEKRSVPTDAGALEIRTYTVEDGTTALISAVCDYGAAASGKDPDTLLDSAQAGAVSNIKGHLVSQKKITLGANHGVAFEAENDSAHLSARAYLVGTKLYQMIVALPLNSNYADTTRFLDSFQLLPPTAQ
jgi:hypothetical protein